MLPPERSTIQDTSHRPQPVEWFTGSMSWSPVRTRRSYAGIGEESSRTTNSLSSAITRSKVARASSRSSG